MTDERPDEPALNGRVAIYNQLSDQTLIQNLSKAIRAWARGKGFEEDWDDIHRVLLAHPLSVDKRIRLINALDRLVSLAQCALLTSEVGELVEALRHPERPDDHLPDVTASTAEIADIIIRAGHLHARLNGGNLDEAIASKMLYNENRPHKHGKEA